VTYDEKPVSFQLLQLGYFDTPESGMYMSPISLRELVFTCPYMMSHLRTFAHRYTEDDLIESICMTCFQTVARSQDQQQMEANEALHVCHPEPLPSAFRFYEA
jgi:hypothetical protein